MKRKAALILSFVITFFLCSKTFACVGNMVERDYVYYSTALFPWGVLLSILFFLSTMVIKGWKSGIIGFTIIYFLLAIGFNREIEEFTIVLILMAPIIILGAKLSRRISSRYFSKDEETDSKPTFSKSLMFILFVISIIEMIISLIILSTVHKFV